MERVDVASWMNFQQTVGRLSERYGVSPEAVEIVAQALNRCGGRMAQFNHPDLGGHGQWLPGMTQISDMFNRDLRERVGGLCADLSVALAGEKTADTILDVHCSSQTLSNMKPMEPMKPIKPIEPMKPMKGVEHGKADRWWPQALGDSPNSSGGQNEMRYAYFADKNRLVIDGGNGQTVTYDTDGHRISGVHQRQRDGEKKIVFTSEKGEMDLNSLHKV